MNEGIAVVDRKLPDADSERRFFKAKLQRMATRMEDLAESAFFDDVNVANGSNTSLKLHIKSDEIQESLEIKLPDLRPQSIGFEPETINVLTPQGCEKGLAPIKLILSDLASRKTHLKDMQTSLEDILFRLEKQLDERDLVRPKIHAPDLAIRTAAVVKEHISTDKEGAIAAQIESLHQDAKHLVS